jgi:hypothetical protein
MSALGQKRTCRREIAMSAIPQKADIAERDWNVHFVLSLLISLPDWRSAPW